MTFVKEDVPATGPATLAQEHQRVVAWAAEARVGAVEYPGRRMVDADLSAAFYYVRGFGMGRGHSFVLVRGECIYEVSVSESRGAGKSATGSRAARVLDVSLPESAPMRRDEIERVPTEALREYFEAHLSMSSRIGFGPASFDWRGARWVVRPRKHSWLYWRTRSTEAWRAFSSRTGPRIWRTVSSPLVAALSLAASAAMGNGLAVGLSGMWLSLRLLQYESAWRLDAWMVGQLKYRHPLGAVHAMSRALVPSPLAAVTVRVEPVEGDPMSRTIRVINRSWVPVPYVSIGAHSIAQLLAPGLIEQLRQQTAEGRYDPKVLERHFPDMVKRWLLPRGSFAHRHRLIAEFPIAVQPAPVVAVITISRFVSGESRGGPGSYLLEVEASS